MKKRWKIAIGSTVSLGLLWGYIARPDKNMKYWLAEPEHPIEQTPNNPDRVNFDHGIHISTNALFKASLQNADILHVGDTCHATINERMKAVIAASHDPDNNVHNILVEDTPSFQKTFTSRASDQVTLQGVDPQQVQERNELLELIAEEDVFSLRIDDITKATYSRFNMDPQLASNVCQHASHDHKIILLYGSGHGSAKNDGMPEMAESQGFTTVRIDMYDSKAGYIKTCEVLHELNTDIDIADPQNDVCYGEELPTLIYLQDEGTVHFTDNTPEALKQAVIKASKRIASAQAQTVEPS